MGAPTHKGKSPPKEPARAQEAARQDASARGAYAVRAGASNGPFGLDATVGPGVPFGLKLLRPTPPAAPAQPPATPPTPAAPPPGSVDAPPTIRKKAEGAHADESERGEFERGEFERGEFEREADAAAEGVARGDGARVSARRLPAYHEGQPAMPLVARRVLGDAGRPLDARTRARVEGSFGRDFGGVRVHADAQAAEAAEAVGARAFTSGRDVVFGRGEYEPASENGLKLLAHELTHVVQQGSDGADDLAAEGPSGRRYQRVPLDAVADSRAAPTPAAPAASERAEFTSDPERTRRRLEQMAEREGVEETGRYVESLRRAERMRGYDRPSAGVETDAAAEEPLRPSPAPTPPAPGVLDVVERQWRVVQGLELLTLDDVTLFDRRRFHQRLFDFHPPPYEIWSGSIGFGRLGLLRLSIEGHFRSTASVAAEIGPCVIRNIRVRHAPLARQAEPEPGPLEGAIERIANSPLGSMLGLSTGEAAHAARVVSAFRGTRMSRYTGTAEMHMPARMRGRLTLVGGLSATSDFLRVRLGSLRGSLYGIGTFDVPAEFLSDIEAVYEDGRLSIAGRAGLTADPRLALDIGAAAAGFIGRRRVWNHTWPLYHWQLGGRFMLAARALVQLEGGQLSMSRLDFDNQDVPARDAVGGVFANTHGMERSSPGGAGVRGGGNLPTDEAGIERLMEDEDVEDEGGEEEQGGTQQGGAPNTETRRAAEEALEGCHAMEDQVRRLDTYFQEVTGVLRGGLNPPPPTPVSHINLTALNIYLYMNREQLDTALNRLRAFDSINSLNANVERMNQDIPPTLIPSILDKIMSDRRSHDRGVAGGREAATRDGLRDVGFRNPFEGSHGVYGRGFDDVRVLNSTSPTTGIVYILEYKGPRARLGETVAAGAQMERPWVVWNIGELRRGGEPGWATTLADAMREGRLRGRAYRSYFDRPTIRDPLNDWVY